MFPLLQVEIQTFNKLAEWNPVNTYTHSTILSSILVLLILACYSRTLSSSEHPWEVFPYLMICFLLSYITFALEIKHFNTNTHYCMRKLKLFIAIMILFVEICLTQGSFGPRISQKQKCAVHIVNFVKGSNGSKIL